jgi:uncharacterized protein
MTLSFTAFQDSRRIAHGNATEVISACKAVIAKEPQASIVLFDDATGRQVDPDWRGSVAQAVASLMPQTASNDGPADAPPVRRGPGRPRLGVVAREVTLLPRHWEWLAGQTGGASVTLRKLVESAIRARPGEAEARQAEEAAYRFMQAMAGDLPNYEEALRAFYRKDDTGFVQNTLSWPHDVREHAQTLVQRARQANAN